MRNRTIIGTCFVPAVIIVVAFLAWYCTPQPSRVSVIDDQGRHWVCRRFSDNIPVITRDIIIAGERHTVTVRDPDLNSRCALWEQLND